MAPLWLDAGNPEHASIVGKAIAFYEARLGLEKRSIDWDELRYEVGDDRLADGLRYALERIYAWKPRAKPYRFKSSPLELRLKLFRMVGSEPGGFAEDRVAMLKRFAFKHGLSSVEELDEYLWSDDPRGYVLVKVKEQASVEDVVKLYNFEVLDTLLSNSRAISFTSAGSPTMPKGTFAKKLVKEVKRLGLAYDARVEGGSVTVNVYGPVELFGRVTRFAWRLSALFDKALPILKASEKWSVRVVVHLKKRDLPCILTRDAMPSLAMDVKPSEPVEPSFDSSVERRFYAVMSSVKKYEVEREPEPLIVGDTLLVPDYAFVRPDGVKWYVEVVGFWRPEYTAKKRAKLEELKKAGLQRLILLVDQKYANQFKGLGFPTFTYRVRSGKLDAPYGAIISLITETTPESSLL